MAAPPPDDFGDLLLDVDPSLGLLDDLQVTLGLTGPQLPRHLRPSLAASHCRLHSFLLSLSMRRSWTAICRLAWAAWVAWTTWAAAVPTASPPPLTF